MSGKLESGSGPDARTTVRARKRLRPAVVAVHTPASSSNDEPGDLLAELDAATDVEPVGHVLDVLADLVRPASRSATTSGS